MGIYQMTDLEKLNMMLQAVKNANRDYREAKKNGDFGRQHTVLGVFLGLVEGILKGDIYVDGDMMGLTEKGKEKMRPYRN